MGLNLIPIEEYRKIKNSDQNEANETPFNTSVQTNYWDILNSDYERLKADINGDGKIDYNEYRDFIISTNEQRVYPKSIDNVHHYYHLDFTVLLAIGMICITMLIKTWLNKRGSF
jgi:hypothetical protein